MINDEIKKIKDLIRFLSEDEELSEDEIETPTTSSGGGKEGSPTVTKWESGVKRGKGNQIGNTKWESGVKRGKGNQIGNTKWDSGVVRGKGNTLL